MELKDFSKVEFASAYGLASQLPPPSGPEFVFAGRSNVGKSSLINRLAGRKSLARVSGTPGKTATINFYTIGEGWLVDLPGYGYAKTSHSERRRWDDLINGYFSQTRDVRLLLQLLDCRHAPSKDDMAMLEYLDHHGIAFVAVLTKADKLKPSQRQKCMDDFKETLSSFNCEAILLTSAEKGNGVDVLRETILAAVGDTNHGL